MELDGVISATQSLGISVVMCLLMAWFVKYMFDKFMALLNEEKQSHKEEMSLLKESLENNTVAITTLTERLVNK